MPENLSEKRLDLRARARELARDVIGPRAAAVDRRESYPWDNVRALTEAGFFGMTIPKEHGGPGLQYLDALLVIEEMAKVCGVTGRIAVEANMGAIGAIMAYGTRAQKTLAAAAVLGGDKPAICITEPQAGSAATEMITRADRRGDEYILNGGKHWITGGGVSRLHLVFARVFDGEVEQGIGGFMVIHDDSGAHGLRPAVRGETPSPDIPEAETGLVIGRREPTLGLRGIPETEILFRDLAVHRDMLLMPPQGLRRGFGALMTAYNAQRVGAGMVALGLAAGAYEMALDYSRTREQFGRPICEFQGLQWMLADMSIQIDAARGLLYKAASGPGFPDVLEAAQAKVFASEMAIRVTSDALQIFGAAGYSRNNPLERMLRDARMFTIGGGTAQILRTLIASKILDRKLPQGRDGYLNLPK
jgi:hypothetical protein